MQTIERPKAKPTIVAERRAEAAERRTAAVETAAARDREDAARLARDLNEMREDRDRWRAQAERLAAALDRLKASAPAVAVVPKQEMDGDLLYGLKAVAGYLRITPRQAKHRVAAGQIPTFKIGGTVCANRSEIGAAALSAAQGGR